MNRTIVFYDEETGERKEYLRYSARLQDFNEAYGPDSGYRVESTFGDLLGLQPGRMAAVNEAIASGFNPVEMGLIKASTVLVCTHSLVNADGQVVRDARAAKPILQEKDLEILETASHQRLMAKLGFGGDLFDEDEDRDIESAQARRSLDEEAPEQATQPQATPAAGTASEAPPEGRTETTTRESKAKPRSNPATPRKPAQSRKAPRRQRTAEKTTEVPPAMARQLKQLATSVGEQTPEVDTFVAAKAELKRLTEKQARHRNGEMAP